MGPVEANAATWTPARRIHDLPARWAGETADATAFVEGASTVSWAQAADATAAAHGLLADAGVGGGDRVLIVAENSLASAALLFACSRLDAWAVPVNARLSARELAAIEAHCAPRCTVFTDGASPDAAAHGERATARACPDSGFGRISIARGTPSAGEPVHETAADQVAALIYTSGTTGQPKGVMLSHANLGFIASVSGRLRRLAGDDVVYGVLPLSHVYGLASTFLGTVNAGGCVELVARFDPAHLADALERGVTVLQGAPAMYAKLLAYLDASGRRLAAPRLRYLSAGGAPLDLDWKRRVEDRFGLALNNGYGLTEAAPTVAQTRIEEPRDDDSIGRALPGVEVRFVDPHGREVADGAVGELLVRGPNIMKGYYRDRAATAAALSTDGWLRTGDLGYRASDGALFLAGRAKELIIRSGFNVYPPEVEAALNAHPRVVQSAVIGRAVSGNEEVLAFVELAADGDTDEAMLKAFVRDRLAPYKRPARIFVVGQLPVNAANKVLKHQLAGLAERLLAQGEAR